ncbi:MAG: hypothetical protein U0350_20150 [Caldilineaceae bacterium]
MRLRNLLIIITLCGALLAACSPSTPNEANTTTTPSPTVTEPATATVVNSTTALTTSASSAFTTTQPQNGASYPGKIAYTAVEKNSVNIFVMTPDRNFQKQLTQGPGVSFQPQWSPDGQWIAYFHYDSQKDITTVWVVDGAGDTAPRLVSPAEGVKTASGLSWSPDDRYLVYQDLQPNSNQRDIFRLDVTSGALVNLTTDSPKFDTLPTWSPDGKQIAFVSDRTNPTRGSDSIWVMGADGKSPRELTTKARAWENTKPAWSPDGKQLAFYRWSLQKNFDAPGGPSGLWVIDMASGKEQRLVDFTDWLPSDAPVWSPDGKLIAFDYGNQDNTDVWVVSTQGGKPTQISKLPGGEKNISWSPDSKAFVFTNFQKDRLTLYLAKPDGSEPKPFFETGGNGFGSWSR